MILRRNPKPEENEPKGSADESGDPATQGMAAANHEPDLEPIDTTPLYGEVINPGAAGPQFGEIIPSTDPVASGEAIVIEDRSDRPDQVCVACGETAPGDARFCEACGTDLAVGVAASTSSEPTVNATEPCVSCDADPSEIDHGWCGQCGTKQPSPRDHQEYDKGWVAAVSDRGRQHRVNEDATAIAVVDDAAILVVCDGVSSTERPEEAAELAAKLVAEQLALAVSAGADIPTALSDVSELAQDQVSALNAGTDREAPSCTIVAAVADRRSADPSTPSDKSDHMIDLHVAWLGDSRAYLVDDSGATLITTDHSWAEEQRALGQLSDEAIEADSRAHSITHWLGADSPDARAELAQSSFAVDQRAVLVLCSDGLWNYAEALDEFAALFAPDAIAADQSPIGTAQRLVQFANDAGGRDNISVALADFTLDPTFRPDLAPPADKTDEVSDLSHPDHSDPADADKDANEPASEVALSSTTTDKEADGG